MKRVLAAAGAAALLAGPVSAQITETVTVDPVVDELVVKAQSGGPAWWRVVDEDSIVYIMVGPSVLPSNMGWDRSVMDFRMKGANRLITAVDLSLLNPKSVLGVSGMLVQAPKLLAMEKRPKPPKGQAPLEQRLPEPALSKFVATRTKIGRPAERYAQLSPMDAVKLLEDDYREYQHLKGGGFQFGFGPLEDQMKQLAKANRVPVEGAYKLTIPAMKVKVETIKETPAPKVYDCVSRAVDRMTQKAASEISEARAWASGDVRPLLRPVRFSSDPDCHGFGGTLSANSPKIGRMEEDYVRAQVAAIERALKKPGHSVAILTPLSPLGRAEWGMLGTKGVLAQLKAKGYEVRTPASTS